MAVARTQGQEQELAVSDFAEVAVIDKEGPARLGAEPDFAVEE